MRLWSFACRFPKGKELILMNLQLRKLIAFSRLAIAY
jgi:hypothetical protein